MMKIKIKKDDNVLVIAGEHKGSEGKVVKIIREKNRAIVEGVNMVKKHAKPSAQNPQGGIIEKEAAIHVSNLSLVSSEGNATRVGFRVEEDGNKVRFAKKNNEGV
jgi:large subunit ribosomal protein L24